MFAHSVGMWPNFQAILDLSDLGLGNTNYSHSFFFFGIDGLKVHFDLLLQLLDANLLQVLLSMINVALNAVTPSVLAVYWHLQR